MATPPRTLLVGVLAALTALVGAPPVSVAAVPPTIEADRAASGTLNAGASGFTEIEDFVVGDDGTIYVLDHDTVGIWDAGSRGSGAPDRSITVPVTSGQEAWLLVVDDEDFVTVLSSSANTNDATFRVFDPTGGLVATRTGSQLDLEQPVAITDVGSRVAVLDSDTSDIHVFNLRGLADTPVRTIDGSGSNTDLDAPVAIGADEDGRIVVSGVRVIPGGRSPYVQVYGATANGDVAPVRTLEGAQTRLGVFAGAVTLDRGTVVTTTYDSDPGDFRRADTRVLRFAPETTGDVAPAAVLGGAATGLGDASVVKAGPKGALASVAFDRATIAGATSDGGGKVFFHRALGPYTKPGKVPGVRVTGQVGAARRTVVWRAAPVNADVPVLGYKVRVTCERRVNITQKLGRGARRLEVGLGSFREGTCVARVFARNVIGTSTGARTTFRVDR